MKVILLCSVSQSQRGKLNSALSQNGDSVWIDQQIQGLWSLGFEVTLVLSGDEADEVLRKSTHLEDCELIFDTNDVAANYYTNLKSGVWATRDWAFAHPLHARLPDRSTWEALRIYVLRRNYGQAFHMARPISEGLTLFDGRLPLLLTKTGNKFIKSLKSPLKESLNLIELQEVEVAAELEPWNDAMLNEELLKWPQ